MASSTKWAIVGGLAIVVALLLGVATWTRVHPSASSPLAALVPAVQKLAPSPSSPTAPSLSPPSPSSTAHSESRVPPTVEQADRGPEPPTAPDPEDRVAAEPTFDVVRVEPSGDAVVAGKGSPNSKVALLASGKIVAQATTDASGQFVLTPALKPGAYDLSLQQQAAGKPARDSKQAVAVSVPEAGKGQVVVALAEPGKPTRVLAAPTAPAAAPEKPASTEAPSRAKLAVRSVELENGTGFYSTGTAPAGARLRVYLNDSRLTDLTAGADGEWTLRVKKGLTTGHYTVRVDSLGAQEKVVARVEVPFDVPTAVAKAAPAPAAVPRPEQGLAAVARAAPPSDRPEAAASPAPADVRTAPPIEGAPAPAASMPATAPAASDADVAASTPAASSPVPGQGAAFASNAVIDAIETARVVRGDNLWNISRVRLGHGIRYTRIYTANADQIRDPNLIYPGQLFVVPKP